MASVVVIASSTSKCEGDDQRAEGYALHIDASHLHDRKDDGQRQRNGKRDDQAGSDAEADEADDENNGDRLQQRRHEFRDGAVDGDGLVRNEFRLDADGQVRGNRRHQFLDVCAEGKNVTAVPHRDRKPDGRFAIYSKLRLRRVGIVTPYLRDIAEAEHASARDEIGVRDILFRRECA